MIVVAAAESGQVEVVARLVEVVDRYYGRTEFEPLAERVARVREELFGERPAGFVLLAWAGGEAVGMAAYSFLWPAVGVTRSLYLKELFVVPGWQRRGIGKQLMAALTEVGRRHGCSRMEWTADDDAPGALRFYAGLGVPVKADKLFYRVTLPTRPGSGGPVVAGQ